jgi:hypothetical protein
MVNKIFCLLAAAYVLLPAPCLAFEGAQANIAGTVLGIRIANDPMYGIHDAAWIHIHYSQPVIFTNSDSTNWICSCPDWYFIINLSTSGGRAAFTNTLVAYSRNSPVFVQLATRYQVSYGTTCFGPSVSTSAIEIRGIQSGYPTFY